VLGTLIAISAWFLAPQLGEWLISWYPFDWGHDGLATVSMWIGVLLIVVLGLVLYKHLVMILAAPFMSPLSERIERHLLGQPSRYQGFRITRALKDLGRGLYISLRNLIREILFVTPLLILSLIPFFGFLPAILIFLIQAYYAGFGNMDYTLERHFRTTSTVRFVKKHRWLAIGNGTVFLFLLMTGLGFIFAPPLATVAATIETVKRLDIQATVSEDEYV
ncbi:MAG: EI24 domain-containing protein, partial [Bacteroidota bacterium]